MKYWEEKAKRGEKFNETELSEQKMYDEVWKIRYDKKLTTDQKRKQLEQLIPKYGHHMKPSICGVIENLPANKEEENDEEEDMKKEDEKKT